MGQDKELIQLCLQLSELLTNYLIKSGHAYAHIHQLTNHSIKYSRRRDKSRQRGGNFDIPGQSQHRENHLMGLELYHDSNLSHT